MSLVYGDDIKFIETFQLDIKWATLDDFTEEELIAAN